LLIFAAACLPLLAESAGPIEPATPAGPALNEERLFGVMPNYQTVLDPSARSTSLTAKQKWNLALRETADPFNVASAAMASGFSQAGNQTPKYGWGGAAYGKRFGAALADFGTQNVFSAGILATALHQDPRYFRKGPGSSYKSRIAYSLTRLVVTRTDSGAPTFNSSGIFGMALGIAASNAYYPHESVRGDVMLGRLYTSLIGGVIGNLLSEFGPDVQHRFLRHKRR
jgi:hypothetical protein